MSEKREGPKLTVTAYCEGCAHLTDKYFQCQGDSGFTYYCNAAGVPRLIQSYSSRTPDWCPLLAPARAELVRALTPEQQSVE